MLDMGLGLSIEVNIPEWVDVASVIAVGMRCYPYGIDGDMELGEAIQWAFSDPGGVAALAAMGITWALCQTGTVLIDSVKGSRFA
jgi:hypothetical protein